MVVRTTNNTTNGNYIWCARVRFYTCYHFVKHLRIPFGKFIWYLWVLWCEGLTGTLSSGQSQSLRSYSSICGFLFAMTWCIAPKHIDRVTTWLDFFLCHCDCLQWWSKSLRRHWGETRPRGLHSGLNWWSSLATPHYGPLVHTWFVPAPEA